MENSTSSITTIEEANKSNKSKWYEIDKWFHLQERYFIRNNITDDQQMINHLILNIDVRFWNYLERYYGMNNGSVLYYDLLKMALLQVQRKLDPTMIQYDLAVNKFCEELKLHKLSVDHLLRLLKMMRQIFNGRSNATDDYLTVKVLSQIPDKRKNIVLSNLLIKIKDKLNEMEDKKSKKFFNKKMYKSLKIIEETTREFLDYFKKTGLTLKVQ